MSSFRDLKNASGRNSKIVRDFASSDICVSLGRFYKFCKGYLPYVPPSSTSSDCSENCHWSTGLSVLPDARYLSSQDDHFEHLIRYFTITNLATLSTVPVPLVPLFTTAHDICMWKRCQNSVAGGGSGVICMLHTTTPLPATKCPLFHKLTPYEVGRLLFYRRNMLIEV